MKMMRGFIILAAFLPVLSACAGGGILKSTEPRQVIYTLRPAPEDGSKTAGAARIVEIAKPQVPPGFETDRIIIIHAPHAKHLACVGSSMSTTHRFRPPTSTPPRSDASVWRFSPASRRFFPPLTFPCTPIWQSTPAEKQKSNCIRSDTQKKPDSFPTCLVFPVQKNMVRQCRGVR